MGVMKLILRKSAVVLLATTLLALVSVFTSGCGTARGFGRDVGHLGQGIERAAR